MIENFEAKKSNIRPFSPPPFFPSSARSSIDGRKKWSFFHFHLSREDQIGKHFEFWEKIQHNRATVLKY